MGSYTCSCLSGYLGDGITCVGKIENWAPKHLLTTIAMFLLSDTNECDTGSQNCTAEANCTNTDGSYDCTCNAGYTGNGLFCNGLHLLFKRVCLVLEHTTDIDECDESSNSECDSNGLCTNIVGSYECSCVDGYSGDGFTCIGEHDCENNVQLPNT